MLKLVACALMTVFTLSASANTWTVDDDGDDFPNANFDNIQAAVDVSQSGDEILVYPGTYRGSGNEVVLIDDGKSISIKSIAGASKTIIDGESTRRCVRYTRSTITQISGMLDGFSMMNGSSSNGGGLRLEGCSPIVLNCVVTMNTASNFGGGVSATYTYSDANAQFEDCVFSNNSAGSGGGGISLDGDECAATFTNCVISDNHASHGGGIRAEDTVAIFSACEIRDNVATDKGGGMFTTPTGDPYVGNCLVSGNTALSGGALFCETGSPGSGPRVASATVCENSLPQIIGAWNDDGDNQVTDYCTVGACCTGNVIICAEFSETDCEAFGGTYLGADVFCQDAECPPPVEPKIFGSCCLSGNCVQTTVDECYLAEGLYTGDGIGCAEADCPTSCLGDVTGDGQVSVNDVLTVIANWGPCP